MPEAEDRISSLIAAHERALLDDWVREQLSSDGARPDLLSESELREQSAEFLHRLRSALEDAGSRAGSARAPEWQSVREMLADLSRNRALRGFSPSETAGFVFSLKPPLFRLLRGSAGEPDAILAEIASVTRLVDELGLYTTEVYQRNREEIIHRQQQELLELSTPVVKLWEGVVVVPLIGTLDSARTQVVMESLLEKIVETAARVAIVDITGVPTVDTLVAQHLIKTVAAARLMGAECIISGIRPQIAQTIVHLGINLQDVLTKATLADAVGIALAQAGFEVRPAGASQH